MNESNSGQPALNFISLVLFLVCVPILALNSTVFSKLAFLGAAVFLERVFVWEEQGYKTRKRTLLNTDVCMTVHH
jgi:hypothetical protein